MLDALQDVQAARRYNRRRLGPIAFAVVVHVDAWRIYLAA
jgi:hypothetical protein